MDEFEAHRPHLHAVATRMLGSEAEADDALQEAWLRFDRTDTSDVENLGGWLTTVVSRVCLTMLDARKRRREEALEDGRLPDPVITPDAAPTPRVRRWRPTRSAPRCSSSWRRCSRPSAWRSCCTTCSRCRSTTSRRSSTARRPRPVSSRRGRGGACRAPTPTRRPPTARSWTRSWPRPTAATSSGLLAVLDPDVVLRADDGGGALHDRRGRARRRQPAPASSRARASRTRRSSTALAGFVATEDGVPVAVLAFMIVDGRITAIDALGGIERVAGLGLQAFVG